MSNLLIACDLHNTLVWADRAWTMAFSALSGKSKEIIRLLLQSKISRKLLAEELEVSYESVYGKYREYLTPNEPLLKTIKALSGHGIPVIVVSAASHTRVVNDVALVERYLKVEEAYSKEVFNKDNRDDWQKLIEKYKCDQVLYFGNDEKEDRIEHEKVISVLIIR